MFYDDSLTQEENVDEYMQDVLTALCYYASMLSLKVEVEYILDDRSGYSSLPLTVKVLRKETIRTNLDKVWLFCS